MQDAKAVEKQVNKKKRSLEEALSEPERDVAEGLCKKHGEFKVCANCASLDLRSPPSSMDMSFTAFKETWRYYCATCGYEGIPLIFTEIAPYEKFFSDRRKRYNEGRDQIEPNYLLPHSFSEQRHDGKRYVAVILSFLLPGLGQAYNGEKSKAAKVFAAYALSLFLFVLAGQLFLYNARSYGLLYSVLSLAALLLTIPSLVGLAASYLYAAVDAYSGVKAAGSFKGRRRLKAAPEGS